MYQGKHILAIVPARGGSKRLPRKNVLPLDGRPLIAWSIQTALACPLVDAVLVSTDDPEIAGIAQAEGAEVRMRPSSLAQDDTPSLPVFVDALMHHATPADLVLVLQPTSPFRRAADLTLAITSVVDQQADALIAVSKAKLGPEWMLPLGEGLLRLPSEETLDRIRVQDQQALYQPNGYLYVYTRATLLAATRYAFGPRTLPLFVPHPHDLDIDDATDFKIAQAISHEFHFHCP
jgi:CMP-N,N'-diacetyllegionaminic acid synthase